MLCDFEWPYEGRNVSRNEMDVLRKELNDMTERACRLSRWIENNLLPIPEQDRKWWDKHKKYDKSKGR